MASFNTIVKRKQYLWLGIVVVGTASAIGGALYLSDVDMSGNGETVAEQEPVPDAGFLPLILQADQKYRISAITARLMLQIMSGRLTGH